MSDFLPMWIMGGAAVFGLIVWLAVKYDADWLIDILLLPLLLLESIGD